MIERRLLEVSGIESSYGKMAHVAWLWELQIDMEPEDGSLCCGSTALNKTAFRRLPSLASPRTIIAKKGWPEERRPDPVAEIAPATFTGCSRAFTAGRERI
jgi:hypothetical protein